MQTEHALCGPQHAPAKTPACSLGAKLGLFFVALEKPVRCVSKKVLTPQKNAILRRSMQRIAVCCPGNCPSEKRENCPSGKPEN